MGDSVTFSNRDLDNAVNRFTYTVVGVLLFDRDSGGNRPDKHDVFVVADVIVEVHEGEHTPGWPDVIYAFSLLDDRGVEYRSSPHVIDPELTGTLKAGDRTRGNMVFDVPFAASIEGKIQLKASSLAGSTIVQWKFHRYG